MITATKSDRFRFAEYDAVVKERDAYKKILLDISDSEKLDGIVLYRIRKLLMKFLLVN